MHDTFIFQFLFVSAVLIVCLPQESIAGEEGSKILLSNL